MSKFNQSLIEPLGGQQNDKSINHELENNTNDSILI